MRGMCCVIERCSGDGAGAASWLKLPCDLAWRSPEELLSWDASVMRCPLDPVLFRMPESAVSGKFPLERDARRMPEDKPDGKVEVGGVGRCNPDGCIPEG